MSFNLERLAQRVSDDPYFLAAVLHAYAIGEGLDDTALAAKLGCRPAALTRLRLCRAPRPAAPFFWQDVQRIATSCAVNPESLAEVVRRGQSLMGMRGAAADPASGAPGTLLAARDGPPGAGAEPPPGGAP